MKKIILSSAFLVASYCLPVSALPTDSVTIEGPVKVVTLPGYPEKVVYWLEDSNHVKYKVVLPEDQQLRLSALVKESPSSVIRFDGTIVDKDAEKIFTVRDWHTTTKTTTVTDSQGNSKTVEETTTVR